jgi:hypothetical protein
MSILPCPPAVVETDQHAQNGRALHAQLVGEAVAVIGAALTDEAHDVYDVATAVHRAAPDMEDQMFTAIVGLLAS